MCSNSCPVGGELPPESGNISECEADTDMRALSHIVFYTSDKAHLLTLPAYLCIAAGAAMVRSARRVVLALLGLAVLVLVVHQLTSRSAQLCPTIAGDRTRDVPLKEVSGTGDLLICSS